MSTISQFTPAKLKAWIELYSGTIVGPIGPEGPEGPQGPAGADGVDGDTMWDTVTGGINYAGGKVGIGDTSPTNLLTLKASGNSLPIKMTASRTYQLGDPASVGIFGDGGTDGTHDLGAIRFSTSDDRGNDGAAGWTRIYAGGSSSNYTSKTEMARFAHQGSGTDYITLYTEDKERMRIDASGNVKINTGNLELSNGGGWTMPDANWVRSLNNVAVYNGSSSANAFATPGDFTAGYSDMRLKTHLGTIPDALDKVCSLEGFYYERNEKAVELGYTGGERRVGLSAQDVQAVLPEVVKDAPINIDNGTDYLTVDYERVVPLLVEAIKAQQIQIDELKRNQK